MMSMMRRGPDWLSLAAAAVICVQAADSNAYTPRTARAGIPSSPPADVVTAAQPLGELRFTLDPRIGFFAAGDPINGMDPDGRLSAAGNAGYTARTMAIPGPNIGVSEAMSLGSIMTPELAGGVLNYFEQPVSTPAAVAADYRTGWYYDWNPVSPINDLRRQYSGATSDEQLFQMEADRRNVARANWAVVNAYGGRFHDQMQLYTASFELTAMAASLPFDAPSASSIPWVGRNLSTQVSDGIGMSLAGRTAPGFRTAQEAGISAADALRIQNAANRTGQRITVIGSRARGASNPNDWDYILSGPSRARHSASSSLPRGTSGGATTASGRESGIDIFQSYNPNAPGYKVVDPNLPHVIFEPAP